MRKLKLQELNRISIPEYKEKVKSDFCFVLDNVRSALNVGSTFRTSDAFRAEGLYLCGITARPPHKEIMKTAIGASASVDWHYFESVADAILELKAKGYLIAGVEQTDQSVSLYNFTIPKDRKVAYVLGNEVEGIHDEVLPLLDTAIEIPQYGTKHSFNVSVCAGIVGWHHILQSGAPDQ